MVLRQITTREEFVTLRNELGVRVDWHEPDEQEVDARVVGASFDNAGFWGSPQTSYKAYEELHVVLYKEGDPVAAVNLATLCAWASGLET